MADIKTLLGDAYREGMTVEEINQALSEKNFVEASAVQKMVDKATFDKTASELSATKKRLAELERASMTEEEKAKKALADAEEKAKMYNSMLNRLSVEKMFVSSGLSENDYKDIIDDIVSDDTDKTMKLANNLVSLVKNQRESTEKALKAELLKGTPRTPAGTVEKNELMDYSKKIEEALASGDSVTAAYLTRMLQEKKGE